MTKLLVSAVLSCLIVAVILAYFGTPVSIIIIIMVGILAGHGFGLGFQKRSGR